MRGVAGDASPRPVSASSSSRPAHSPTRPRCMRHPSHPSRRCDSDQPPDPSCTRPPLAMSLPTNSCNAARSCGDPGRTGAASTCPPICSAPACAAWPPGCCMRIAECAPPSRGHRDGGGAASGCRGSGPPGRSGRAWTVSAAVASRGGADTGATSRSVRSTASASERAGCRPPPPPAAAMRACSCCSCCGAVAGPAAAHGGSGCRLGGMDIVGSAYGYTAVRCASAAHAWCSCSRSRPSALLSWLPCATHMVGNTMRVTTSAPVCICNQNSTYTCKGNPARVTRHGSARTDLIAPRATRREFRADN